MRYCLFLCLFSFIFMGCGVSPTSNEKMSKSVSALYESDPDNCGAAGYVCVGGRTCENSVCTPAWLPMSTDGAPTPRVAASGGTIDGKYVIHGGCTTWDYDSTPEVGSGVYDPQTDTWSQGPDMAYPRFGGMTVSTPSSMITYGGLPVCWDGDATNGPVEVLSSLVTGWTESAMDTDNDLDDPSDRFCHAMAWTGTGSSIFVYGGSRPYESNMNSGWVGDVMNPPAEPEPDWIDATCYLDGCERSGQQFAFLDGDYMTVIGGHNNVGPTMQGLRYELSSNTWSLYDVPEGTPDINQLSGGQTRYADDGNRVYVVGPSSVWIYNKTTTIWTEDTSSMPSGFSNDAPMVWIGSEMMGYSGWFSTVGGRYQPPAPQQ